MGAEAAVNDLAAAARGTNGPLQAMNASIVQQSRSLATVQRGMGLTTAEGLNMGRQIADVGVSMAMGMNPFMIAIQQGPQIMDVFQMAAIRTGTTVQGAMAATGRAVWAALAPLLPIIAAITAGAGLIAGAWGLATRAVSKDIGDLADGLNLTADQIKHLEEQGVSTSVTMGDVFRGVGTTIKESLFDMFGDEISWLGEKWNSFLDGAWRAVVAATKGIAGAFLGTLYVVRDTWSMLPFALGDVAFAAANFVVRGVTHMINAGVGLLNGLIDKANAAVDRIPGMEGMIPRLMEVSTGGVGNPFEGAARAMGERAGTSWAEGWAQGASVVERTAATLASNIRASGQARVRNALPEERATRAGSNRATREKDGPEFDWDWVEKIVDDMAVLERLTKGFAGAADDATDGAAALFSALTENAPLIHLQKIADELRLIDGLTRDMSQGLSSAFGDSGRALGDLLTVTSGYRSRLAEIDLAERENRLTGAQAARERAQAEVQSYGDMAAAARGFFEEGSTGYRVLLAIEQLYRAQQLAGMLIAIATGEQETAASVAGSMTRGAANMAEGASKMFAALGPYAFPVVAAMVTVLAGFGLRGGGGGGSRSAANDNVPGGDTTANLRSSAAGMRAQQDEAARREPFEVRVTADREGLNAYVVTTARQEAAPMAERAGLTSFQAARTAIPAEEARRRRFSYGAGN
jgi:hypothetical protein